MKILLVNPEWSSIYTNRVYRERVLARFQPLNLLSLAAYLLRDGGFDVEVIDLEIELLSDAQLLRRIARSGPDLVGLYASTPTIQRAHGIASIVKNIGKNIAVVIGGPHATALPEETLRDCPSFDFAIRGEGEVTMFELCKCLEKSQQPSKVKGISYRCKDKVITTQERPMIRNLDCLPFQALSLINAGAYRSLAVSTSRGCPFGCIFCNPVFGRKVRYRSAKNIVGELELLTSGNSINFVSFTSDTFTLNRRLTIEICNEMVRKGLNKRVGWSCTTRVDSVDGELLTTMKKSGCVSISFGVESGSQRNLDLMQKGITLEQVRSAFRKARDAGLETSAFFLLGFPFETKGSIEESIRLAKEIKPSYIEFNILSPLPGTQLFSQVSGPKQMISQEWNTYSYFGNGPINMQYLTRKELLECQKKAFRQLQITSGKILAGYMKHLLRSDIFWKRPERPTQSSWVKTWI
jgi:anaerobic magnesium-protoporphyrin IX monomethyl ester cyclase